MAPEPRPVGAADRERGALARLQSLLAEAGDPKAGRSGLVATQVLGVGDLPAAAVLAGRLDGEEDVAIRRGRGGGAQLAEAGGVGRQGGVLAVGQKVEVHQPDRALAAAGGEAGELAGDGGGPLPPRGGDELHDAALARLRRAERLPELRHFGGQVHHGPNRSARGPRG